MYLKELQIRNYKNFLKEKFQKKCFRNHLIIGKGILSFYLCPALFAIVISGSIAGYVGGKFNFYTGIKTPAFQYFGISLALFFSIYCVYFLVTYIGFVRNVDSEG